jgi:type I restriction enzyme, S subunit
VSRENAPLVTIGDLASSEPGAFKIGPFGSSLKKSELVARGIPVLGIENVLPNQFEMGARRFISSTKFKELADYAIRPGDILVTTMGTIGRAAVVPKDVPTAIIDSHLFRMRVDARRVLPRYLAYALNSNDLTRQLAKKSRGAIMDGLNTTILKECLLRVPSLRHQELVLSKLDAATQLSRKHRFALGISEGLLGAAFLEMFASGATPRIPLVELAAPGRNTFVNGPFGSDLLTSELVQTGTPVIYIRDISQGKYIRVSNACVTQEKATALTPFAVEPGDVLVAKVGDPPGIAAVYPDGEPVGVVTQDVIRIRPNRSAVLPEYLAALFNSSVGRHLLKPIVVQGTRERFGLTPFKQLRIPIPKFDMQVAFSRRAQAVESLVRTAAEALRQAEHLFQTLLHEAFGERI